MTVLKVIKVDGIKNVILAVNGKEIDYVECTSNFSVKKARAYLLAKHCV